MTLIGSRRLLIGQWAKVSLFTQACKYKVHRQVLRGKIRGNKVCFRLSHENPATNMVISREVRRTAILFIDHQVSQWKLWFAHSFQFYRSSKGLYSFWIAESRSGSREIVHINELRNNIARPSTAEWCGEFPTFECTLGRLKKRRQLSDKLCLDMFWIIPFHGECKHPADSASLR